MRIFITGATGYLGGCIAQKAVQRGYELKALYRTQPGTQEWGTQVEWVQGDVLNPESLEQGMQGCDAVIHSAALVSIWERERGKFQRINKEGTENVFRAAARAGITKVIYTSSFFALGPTTERPADESWFNTDTPPPTEYARSKREAEKMLRKWMADGFPVIALYPALIYGPGKSTQGNHVTQMVLDYVSRHLPGILGYGLKRWTFSYIDDVAEGHLLALEKGKTGERYILGGEDANLLEFMDILQDLTGVPPPRLKIPYSVAKVLALLEESRASLSGNYVPRLTREVVDVYKHHWRYSSQKAITQLGYTRTPLKTGLWKILESYGIVREDRSTIL